MVVAGLHKNRPEQREVGHSDPLSLAEQ